MIYLTPYNRDSTSDFISSVEVVGCRLRITTRVVECICPLLIDVCGILRSGFLRNVPKLYMIPGLMSVFLVDQQSIYKKNSDPINSLMAEHVSV